MGSIAQAHEVASSKRSQPAMDQETTAITDELFRLYSKRILALTAQLADSSRLENPDATVTRRSPLCGSTVTVDLCMENGRVSRYGQDVKACALGQASAAVLGQNAVGMTGEELARTRDALQAMLKQGGDPPGEPFANLEALLPARDFKNRHASILLAYDAAAEAARIAEQ